ncbi:MAG: aminotransferase class V-fold PLP-dependent enzyme [Selenomonadaceae bacterium]|nr:aminotransferase class V-fold PLP-dependent enzyme [Selenomonadaceae bacterium]MBR6267407.1 aminotransferase class V-fold PLP-dependent enzyme [Selenomonadaceae bacterium]
MKETAYFDNAATTFPKPECVYQAMDSYYRQAGGSAGRGNYEGAAMAGKLLQDVRHLLKKLFHTEIHEAILTSSATEAMNLILRGIEVEDGDVIYMSPFEHNAVSRTLHYLAKQKQIAVEHLSVDPKTLQYDLADIRNNFQKKSPKLVIMSHASNVCGAVAPAAEIFSMAKKAGAITVLDMAQTAGLLDLDLAMSQVDCAVFAGHKTLLGPFGAAGFMLKQGLKLEPLLYGGTGVDSANPEMPAEGPLRYEAGSHNMYALAGLQASLIWILEQGIASVHEKEEQNKERLMKLLSRYSFVHLITPADQVGVVSTTFVGLSSDEAGRVLSEQGVAVRTGLQCAPEAHRFLGTFPSGTVRFSVSALTAEKDFEILQGALDYIEENM